MTPRTRQQSQGLTATGAIRATPRNNRKVVEPIPKPEPVVEMSALEIRWRAERATMKDFSEVPEEGA